MNLLIVDDHPVNCKLLRMQLEAEGHRVLVATNGIEALEILDRESVDGVVSDILMPVMDGFQLCLEIRKRKNLARLPFIFYTGTFKSPQDREFARTVGADQYLTKPSTAREILAALEYAAQTTRDRIAVSAARHDTTYVLKQYNESLVRKLEEQKQKLGEQNLELEELLKNLQIAHDSKQESEQRFRAIFDHAGVGISIRPAHDRKLPWTQVNDHFCKLLGYTRDELLKLSTTDITPADGQARAINDNQRLLSDSIAGYSREKQLIRKDGQRIWVLLTVATLPGTNGRQANLIATYQDITERKAAAEKVSRLNRVYAVLSGINTLIVHVTDRKELFDGACRIVIEHGNFGMAWIGMLDSATQDVTPVAWAGEGAEAYGSSMSSALEDSPRGKGPVGQSIRERRPVISNNITDVARPRVAEMVRLGLRSQITLPLLEGQTIVGTFTMYAKEPNFFDEEEVRLLAELAGDISFAIGNIGRQKKLDKLSRIRAISSSINYAIVHIQERRALLEEACRIAVEHGGFGIAWIGKYDPATLDVTAVAWAGVRPEQFVRKSTVHPDVSEGQGAMGRAIRERKPVFMNDLSLNPAVGGQRREEALRRGYRSLIALPLFVGGEVFGNLSMFTKEVNFFTDEEVVLLMELAGNISFALENISRQQKIEKLSRIREISSEINATIARVRNRQELLDATCNIAVKQAGFPLAWIGMLDPATQDLKPAAMAGPVLPYGKLLQPSVREDNPAGQGTNGRAFREKKPVVDNDMAANPSVGVVREEGFQLGIRAALSLPLLVEGAAVGVMGLYANEKDYFDAEEISLLTEVAGDVSSALEHIARQEKLDKLARIRAISSAINAAIVHARDSKSLFKEACRIAVEQGRLGSAWIGTLDPETLEITPVAWAGEGSEEMRAAKSTARDEPPRGQGAVSRAVRERRAIFNNDLSLQSFGGPRRDAVLKLGFRSMIALPLLEGNKVVATFTLYAREPDFFDADEVALLTELTGNVSFALEYMARQQKVDKLSRIRAILSAINAAIVHARNRQELFDEACRIAVERGRLGSAWIGSLNQATLDITPVAWAGEGPEDMRTAVSTARDEPPRGQGSVSRAVRERRVVVDNELSLENFSGPRRKAMLKLGFHSLIALPLFEGDAVAGTFSLCAREAGFFDADEVALLTELAGNVSFALEHMARQQRIEKLSRIRTVSSEVNAAIVRSSNRKVLFDEVCRIAVKYGNFGIAWVGLYDPGAGTVTPVAWGGTDDPEQIKKFVAIVRTEHSLGKGELIRAILEKTPVFSNDMSTNPDAGGMRRRDAVSRGYRSHIVLPLMTEGQVVAAVALFTRELNFFTEVEVEVLSEVASNISLALEHLAQQEKIEKLSRIRAISSEINVAIVRVRERNELLKNVCRIVSEQGKIRMVWIGTIDQEKQTVEPVTWLGFSDEIAHRVDWKSIGAAQGTLGDAIRTRKAAVRNNIESEIPVGGMRGEALKQGCRSTVSLPLMVGERVVALISLFATGTGYFDNDELALLDEVASNISFALEQIEREEKFARLSRIEAVMGSISGLIVRARDRDELFREACRIAVDEGRLRMSLIGIVDRDTMKVVPVATAGKDEGLLTAIKGILSSRENAPKTMIARAIREKKAVVSNDSQNDAALVFGKQYTESGVRSLAILPLVVSDEVVGVLALYANETGFFDDEEMKLLTELTGNIAFAIDHIAKQERLDYLAYYDALTGLANRTLFLERVAQSIQSAASGGHKLALFLIDLDRFKNINDSLGRAGGDALLRQVATWMTKNLGGANLLARVDADHFAVVLPEVKQEGDVARLIEKSLGAFIAHPFQVRDAMFRIAAKVGVALFPDDGADADTLFRNAEAALKKAKSSGERYLFHTKKMTEAVATRLTLENQLRDALDRGEFVLHYQPKINLASGAVCGLEALIRWQKPGAGLVAPGVFIPLLEETGLILGVGKWAISMALSQHREWTARGIAVPRIAVNVSAIQLQQKDFSDVVTGALQAQGCEPDALELEVTESLLMQDVQESIRTLSILRALGIHIAMDDFGTGYSSLSYLARLPINSLKIDRSFVTEMASSPQDMGIVTTIVALAHSMNLKVVAEGVETEAQSKLLKLLKCDEAQGYLFSKPLPAAEIEPLLRGLATEARELRPAA